MDRFVLRYRGSGEAPRTEIEKVLAETGGVVLEDSDSMLLVELPETEGNRLQDLLSSDSDWRVFADRAIERRGTRKAPHFDASEDS